MSLLDSEANRFSLAHRFLRMLFFQADASLQTRDYPRPSKDQEVQTWFALSVRVAGVLKARVKSGSWALPPKISA
jgi:hypothetical protein